MANPMYGQNKADGIVDGVSRLVKVAINSGNAIVDTGHAAGAHGLAWANPEAEDIIIEGVLLDVTTAATGSATIDLGIAANATTTGDNLLDGVDVGSAAIMATSGVNGGTNGKMYQPMTSSQWITGDFNASAAGLVGNLYIKYFIPSKAS
tara:strand:- start:218 stop:667 length:450 start_codon:yes stop_codon:yes gene_type:complete